MLTMDYLMARVLDNTASQSEKEEFSRQALEAIDDSYDSWEEEHDKLTDEEEEKEFIQLMKDQGCIGNTHEEALKFLDDKFPGNVRREILAKRKEKKDNNTRGT